MKMPSTLSAEILLLPDAVIRVGAAAGQLELLEYVGEALRAGQPTDEAKARIRCFAGPLAAAAIENLREALRIVKDAGQAGAAAMIEEDMASIEAAAAEIFEKIGKG